MSAEQVKPSWVKATMIAAWLNLQEALFISTLMAENQGLLSTIIHSSTSLFVKHVSFLSVWCVQILSSPLSEYLFW